MCSLIHVMSSTFSDADHRAYIAEHWSDTLEESINRIEDFRARRPEHPILDVQYADLARDPVGTVRGVYDALGLEPGAGGVRARWTPTSPPTPAASSAGTATTWPSSGSPRPPSASGSAATSSATTSKAEHLAAPAG